MTAQKVFERAIALMDSGDEKSGEMDTQVTQAYRHRTPAILEMLVEEWQALAPADQPGRSGLDMEDMSQKIELPRQVCVGILPYGLAAHLLLEEDPAAANFFQQRYEELLARFKRQRAEMEVMKLPYGGIELGEDGRWKTWR